MSFVWKLQTLQSPFLPLCLPYITLFNLCFSNYDHIFSPCLFLHNDKKCTNVVFSHKGAPNVAHAPITRTQVCCEFVLFLTQQELCFAKEINEKKNSSQSETCHIRNIYLYASTENVSQQFIVYSWKCAIFFSIQSNTSFTKIKYFFHNLAFI